MTDHHHNNKQKKKKKKKKIISRGNRRRTHLERVLKKETNNKEKVDGEILARKSSERGFELWNQKISLAKKNR